jgi:hypothetical protein
MAQKLLVYGGMVAVFLCDLALPIGFTVGFAYVPVLLLGEGLNLKGVAPLAILFIVLGAVLSKWTAAVPFQLEAAVISNRTLAIIGIIAIAQALRHRTQT